MVGPIVQIFNRSSRILVVMKDGRQYPIPPGYSYVTADLVPYAKDQHPIPGTEDPNTLITDSLISFVAKDPARQRDPLEPIPEAVLAAMPKERINRNLLPPERQQNVETVAMPSFPRGRVGMEQPSAGMSDEMKFGSD